MTELITTLARAWESPATRLQVEKIAAYVDLLVQWNASVNLTGARRPEDVVEDHLPDSFALAKLVPANAAIVDVGAGGGLPGVPFAVLRPDCQTTLLEPRAKRTAFLGAARRVLAGFAAFEIVRGRHDELPVGTFDVAASRATFQPDEWLDVGSPLVRKGGDVIVFTTAVLDGSSAGLLLRESVAYSTPRGVARWAGAFVPRGTDPTAG